MAKTTITPVGTIAPVPASEVAAPKLRRQSVPAAHTPGRRTRKSAKVLDSGARVAGSIAEELFATHGIDAWRRPGVRVTRFTGSAFHPDAAAYMPELDGLVAEVTPQVEARPDFNVLFEFKSQHSAGSASQKISASILDLANASDILGTPAAMILHTPALSKAQIHAFKQEGKRHSVVVLERSEVTRETLVSELVRVTAERRRLMNRLGPMGGYTATKRPPVFEQGFAQRISARNAAGKRLTRYGAQG